MLQDVKAYWSGGSHTLDMNFHLRYCMSPPVRHEPSTQSARLITPLQGMSLITEELSKKLHNSVASEKSIYV